MLRCKIGSLPFLGLRPHALHPGAIQGKEGIKFCHLATLVESERTVNHRTNGSFDGITGLRSRQDGTDVTDDDRADEREFERERGGHGGYDLDDDDGKPVALFELRRMRFVVWDGWIGGLICFKIAISYTVLNA